MINKEVEAQIARRLQEARKSAGLTQLDLAVELRVSRQAVSQWERAASMPNARDWYNLGIVLGASLDYLAYGIRTMPAVEWGKLEDPADSDATPLA